MLSHKNSLRNTLKQRKNYPFIKEEKSLPPSKSPETDGKYFRAALEFKLTLGDWVSDENSVFFGKKKEN